MIRPFEALFLLAVARIVVGKYGYEMTFERAGDYITIEARPHYGHPVEVAVAIETASVALSVGRNPVVPSDAAHQIRRKQRALLYA